MDPKASAKSKRTHSQHGRRNHPSPATIAQKKKLSHAGGQAGGEERARGAHPHTLPSNWDRYGDNDEEGGAENPAGAKQGDVETVPQSKGADFGYLIEQARSQPQEFRAAGPESSSSDDFPVDFMQGGISMLSVRGENLLSWCGDDNFIVDDDRTSSYEVPFLSMDLHALAAQLSKLKLSHRLFIEADLLPEEQCLDEPQKCTEEQFEGLKISGLRHDSETSAFKGHVDSVYSDDIQNKVGSSPVIMDLEILKGEVATNIPSKTFTSQIAKLVPTSDSKPLEQFDSREVLDSTGGTSTHTNPDSKRSKASRFEAAAVEKELDMLLDSFGHSLVSGFPTDGLFNNNIIPQSMASGSVATKRDPGSSRNASSASLDDTIDDLLAGTSLCIKDQKHTAFQQKQAVSSTSLPPRVAPLGSGSMNARSLSRPVAMTAALDESIDDLLAETSVFLTDQKQTDRSQSSVHPPRSAALSSKAIDDFDSWIDTVQENVQD